MQCTLLSSKSSEVSILQNKLSTTSRIDISRRTKQLGDYMSKLYEMLKLAMSTDEENAMSRGASKIMEVFPYSVRLNFMQNLFKLYTFIVYKNY